MYTGPCLILSHAAARLIKLMVSVALNLGSYFALQEIAFAFFCVTMRCNLSPVAGKNDAIQRCKRQECVPATPTVPIAPGM